MLLRQIYLIFTKSLLLQFRKLVPRVVSCRNYKIFSNNLFLKSLNKELSKYLFSPDWNNFDRLCQICTDTLNKYAPCKKKKKTRKNQSPFINKILKTIIKWTKLRNVYLKLRTTESKLAYKKHGNYCVAFIRKGKKEYYGSVDVKDITPLENP